MKIYLPSGYSSEFYTNNRYYEPGVHDEAEMPVELVSYLIKEKFACYILEALVDKLAGMETEIAALKAQPRATLEMVRAAQWYNASRDPMERELYVHLIMTKLAKMMPEEKPQQEEDE